MQYFNRSNGEVDYIRDLLRSTYIPTVRIFNTLTNIQPVPSTNSVTRSLIPQSNLSRLYTGETVILNNTIQVTENGQNLRYVRDYIFGNRYPNITSNYLSNKPYYDSDLHENLGRYLRAYRDYYLIDVMNFYNCFSNRFITSYGLPIPAKPSENTQLPDHDPDYKVTAFPVILNTEYKVTFFTSSVSDVQYQFVYFNGESPLGAAEVGDNGEPIMHSASIGTSFTIEADISNINGLISSSSADKEKFALSSQRLLYVFLKFPATIECPIVVLEQPKFTLAINNELDDLWDEEEQVAFSNTLLEYLTGSVICPSTTIHRSVHLIQNKLLQRNFVKKYGVGGPTYEGVAPGYKFTPGIFDEGMHQLIYKAFFDIGVPKITVETNDADPPTIRTSYPKGYDRIPNFIGYVDKNVEELIMNVPDDSNT